MYDTLEIGKWYTTKNGGFYNYIGRETGGSGVYMFHTLTKNGVWDIYRFCGAVTLEKYIELEDKTELKKALKQAKLLEIFRIEAQNMAFSDDDFVLDRIDEVEE